MDKPAIRLKYINSRVTSFFDVLGKTNHRPIAQMRLSPHDRMIWCSQLLVDPHIPKKTLSYNGWAMEQSTLLQNQFPVEEVKIDIMFKCKLCIYNTYIYKTHAY